MATMKKATEQATVRRSKFFCTTLLPAKAPVPPKVGARPLSLPECRKMSKSTAAPRIVSSATRKYVTLIYLFFFD